MRKACVRFCCGDQRRESRVSRARVRGIHARRYMAMNLSPIEMKVREATSNDPWGASSTELAEIANEANNRCVLKWRSMRG